MFVCRVGEDQYGQADGVSTKGDGLEDGKNSLVEADHIVVSWRTDGGGVALLSGVEQVDDVRRGQHDSSGNM